MSHAIGFFTLLWIFMGECIRIGVLGGYAEDNYPASVLEDAHLTTLQLLTKYKYPGESHQVTTEDKYVLTLHRIPRPGAKPVLLIHGLEDTSSTWISMGPHSGLAYYLYENGYDVWMGNARGNRYSRGHVKLNPNTDRAFWSFSWHEIGMYDLPAMIDGILEKTGYQKLSYFGHSQGTTSFFVMTSSRPEYNAKIHIMNALAPVAFMGNMKAPLISIGRMGINVLGGSYELFPHSYIFFNQCLTSAGMMKTCLRFYWQLVGKNREELNMTMFPVVLGHLPGGCNAKQPQHYIQLQSSDRFCQYDYDPKENQRIYGRSSPPDYRLEKITAPVALFYGSNDYFAAVEDVKRLAKVLPNVVENHLFKKWNHMDMIWGVSARRTIQPRMLKLMQYWESHGGANQNKTNAPPEMEEEEGTTELVLETSTTITSEETTQRPGVVEEKDDVQATDEGDHEEAKESLYETTYSPVEE
ncbi:lipase 1 [Drosophila bipectinata]|uniref:lipase 1 n=1 Tax=Drosophila bipectinata TaxID=42026 RepID=UPI001C8ADB0F|nr:lipase 1 [Drosophila bipectinata]